MSKLKNPPSFDPEADDYASWKADVAVWKLFTDTAPEKIGGAIYLSTQNKARDVVRSVPTASIGTAEGYDLIIAELDKVYLTNESARAFAAFTNYYEYRRDAGDNWQRYIVEYEKRYLKVKQSVIGELHTGLQAFFLLKSANVTAETEKLARGIAKLEYPDMRDKLMKVFGDPGVLDSQDAAPQVKEETLYGYGYERGRGGRSRGASRGGSRGGFRGGTSFRGGRAGGRFAAGGRFGAGGRRCYYCDGIGHIKRDCPSRNQDDDSQGSQEGNVDEVNEQNFNLHITLISSRSSRLLHEALGKRVLDTGCSKTVAGVIWYVEYLSTLSADDRGSVTESKSKSVFRFGDGKETTSLKLVTVAIYIGKVRMLLDIDIVEFEIPLLISKGAMKQMDMKLDLVKDIVTVNGENIKLCCTSTGHYCLPISRFHLDLENVNVVFHLQDLLKCSDKQLKNKALKLHRQFSHPSKGKLVKTLREGGIGKSKFIKAVNDVSDNCKLCLEHKKPSLKPIVGFRLADTFNECICMDLKEFKHNVSWILHLIDGASRYSAACLISTKKKEVVVSKIFQIWIGYFGSPKKMLSDNGGEFANDVLMEMNEKLGVETATTAAESPFSNGVVERHNAILNEAFQKTLADVNCEPEMALSWAVSAKNALANHHGFCPNQLAFGWNVNLPTVMTDMPPALNKTTSSDIVRKNLEAVHNARANFIKAESSERIRRALRSKTRTCYDTVYLNGDLVYYKRKGKKGWHGIAKVVGQEGKTVLIRHGSAYHRCHPCHLQKAIPSEQKSSKKKKVTFSLAQKQDSDKTPVKDSSRVVGKPKSILKDSSGVVGQTQSKGSVDSDSSSESDENYDEDSDDNDGDNSSSGSDGNDDDENSDADDDGDNAGSDDVSGASSNEDVHTDNEISSENDVSSGPSSLNASASASPVMSSVMWPPLKSYIEYSLRDGSKGKATILSKQPKRGGSNSDWLNVHVDGQDKPSSVNWKHVLQWKMLPAPEKVVLLTASDELTQEVLDAKAKELKNLVDNDVYEAVPDRGQRRVSTKWVMTEKFKENIRLVKARLVARGFEENLKNTRTDSPTCSRQALRLCFVTAATMGWEIHSLDVTSAFLQGNIIEREVFVQPPAEWDGYKDGLIWKLKRCLYGLNDAPRAWYERVVQELKSSEGKTSLYDEAMFIWHDQNRLIGLLDSHVDDFVYCGTPKWHETVITPLFETFNIRESHSGSFKYVGLNVVQNNETVMIDQNVYIKKLEFIPISAERAKQRDETLTDVEKKNLRSLSGQLLWATTQTRIDSAFNACMISNYGKNPTVNTILLANKAVKKMQSVNVKLLFPNLGDVSKLEIITFADAAHANLPSGASQGGLIVFLAGNGKLAPITWQSRKLLRVTKSPFAAETMVQAEVADIGVLIGKMVAELYHVPMPVVRCHTDSKSLVDHLVTSHIIQDARLRVDIARIREMVKLSEINMRWVPKEEQLADSLTKAGASPKTLLDVLQAGCLHR